MENASEILKKEKNKFFDLIKKWNQILKNTFTCLARLFFDGINTFWVKRINEFLF